MKVIKQGSYFILMFLLLSAYVSTAQTAITIDNFNEVNIDQLSDAQINSFWQKAQQNGLSMEKLQELAVQKKMDPSSIAKLKARIEKNNSSKDLKSELNDGEEDSSIRDSSTSEANTEKVKASKIFGSELFSNKKLTFEPNIKIATPPNYQIGPDDEIIIDIYGYSDASYKLKVSPNGQIRIPTVGLVSVGGLTMEQAQRKITNDLKANYSSIATGETKVGVSLGTLRSIHVTIIGEVALPGTYTLSSLATVFNALYASGGPNKNGSFRNIKVIRGGKTILKLDIYDFLVKGETAGNINLRDQDVIKVEPYEARIEFIGEVKRPGIYEVKANETLKNMLSFTGGFTDKAYRDRVKVTRNTSKEKSVADVPLDMFDVFTVQSGDVFQVGKLIDRYANRVEIRGAVFRPGYFSMDEGLTVKKLIEKAEGLKEDAFMSRAIIYRLKDDNTAEVIAFDVNEIMSGGNDIKLKREDVIEINSKLELKESYNVTILGAVLRPNAYPFAENARVEDLIVAAGGLKENAAKGKIEIARRIKGDGKSMGTQSTQILTYEVSEDLKVKSDIFLEPFDIVTVYSIPGYGPQRNVKMEGEVGFPGQYSLTSRKDRVSDIIKRAGGISQYGNIDGAILVRTTKLSKTEEIIRKQKIDAFIKQTKDTARAEEIGKELSRNISIVGISLSKILKQPGGKQDIFLEDGDIIRVPRLAQTVKISGEVLYPVQIPYSNGKKLKKYVNGSGGFTQRALKSKAYVVYANGSARGTSTFLFFKKYPKLLPGAEIIVPMKEERRKMSAAEIAAITSSFATVVLLVFTIYQAN
jgi:protein involved in polysaccharide export with SLBB domain